MVAGAADRLWADSMPEAYERWLAPAVFRPFAVDMARRVSAHAPQRVLEIEARGDLAASTAVVARELERRLGAGRLKGVMSAHLFEATAAP